MRRLAVLITTAAAALALAAPAHAWPPVCKPAVVYNLTGICL